MGKAAVKLHTRLRRSVGKEQIDVILTRDHSLKRLLVLLSREYPKLEPLLSGEFGFKHLMILINNNHVGPTTEKVLERRVNDGDIVSILEPAAAG